MQGALSRLIASTAKIIVFAYRPAGVVVRRWGLGIGDVRWGFGCGIRGFGGIRIAPPPCLKKRVLVEGLPHRKRGNPRRTDAELAPQTQAQDTPELQPT